MTQRSRIALPHNYAGATAFRACIFIIGAILLFGYGSFLNLAPLEFREVVYATSRRCLSFGRWSTSHFFELCPRRMYWWAVC